MASKSAGQRVAAIVEHRAFPLAALAVIYLAAAWVYIWRLPSPWCRTCSRTGCPRPAVAELRMGPRTDLARLELRASPALAAGADFREPGDSVVNSYQAAKVLGAFLASSVVVPVWLLARAYVGPRLALIPAALCIVGLAWMQITEFMASENLAFPLATASLAATVMAMRDTRSRWIAVSLGFAMLAALSRTQMLVLPVILVVALIGDVLRQPRGRLRARMDAAPACAVDRARDRRARAVARVYRQTRADQLQRARGDREPRRRPHDGGATGRVLDRDGGRDPGRGRRRRLHGAAVRTGATTGSARSWSSSRRPCWSCCRWSPGSTRGRRTGSRLSATRCTWRRADVRRARCRSRPDRPSGAHSSRPRSLSFSLLAVDSPKNYLEQPAVYGTQTRLDKVASFFGDHVGLGAHARSAADHARRRLRAHEARRRAAGLAIAAAVIAAILITQSWTTQSAQRDIVRRGRRDRASGAPRLGRPRRRRSRRDVVGGEAATTAY